MAVPKKLLIEECDHCSRACTGEEIRLQHTFLKEKRVSSLVFCSQVCMWEYFGIPEKVQERVDALKKKELDELYKRVCPACVRRFDEIT